MVERLAILNRRFRLGGTSQMKDSGDLEGAGVLARQIDKNNDEDLPWLPCPATTWCADLADRWPATLLNPKVLLTARVAASCSTLRWL